MPLKLCEATLSCGNYAAVEIGAKLLCVPDAAVQDLKKLLRDKTFEQLNQLAASSCGRLPIWAKSGISREPVQAPEPKRGRGRPRKWLNANQRWLNWSWRKGWIARKVGRPKTARWIGVSDRERNTILNREWRTRRTAKKLVSDPAPPTFIEFCIEEGRLQRIRRNAG
jgi:hypothetical protein